MTHSPIAEAMGVTGRCLLLVEGVDEERFFGALLSHLKIADPAACQIISAGGNNFHEPLAFVRAAIREARVVSIGVVRDADESTDGAFESVRGALASQELDTPTSHAQFTDGVPRVGVFIMPDGKDRGALESLCQRSIEPDVRSCVQDYLDCLHERVGWGEEKNTAQTDKAFVHAFLASTKRPEARLGEGAERGDWNLSHEAFRPIRDFLTQLVA